MTEKRVEEREPAAAGDGTVGDVATRFFSFGSREEPMKLFSGQSLGPVTVAYETYGELSATKDNAILVFHALTGSQHAAGMNPGVDEVGELWNEECQEGWWERFVGPGKPLDTRQFFVVCANYLGGCYGSSGPISPDPANGRPYGASFPRVRFADTVDAHLRLMDHFGVDRIHAVIGASTGAMCCLSLATRYPERVARVIPIAGGLETTPLQRVHNFEQILAIQNDPDFKGGDYERDRGPERGLTLARMISHKSFVSLEAMEQRSRSQIDRMLWEEHWYDVNHPLESYMLYQGSKLPVRFDANAYLRILDAWQTFDLLEEAGVSSWAELFSSCGGHRYLVFSIDSDVCFYPEEQQRMVAVLTEAGIESLHVTVHSRKGHDSFLLEPALYGPHLDYFLTRL